MNKGFTLLELLVAVMIMGILAAIAIPQYSRSVRRAEMIEGLSQGKTILDSALRFKAANGLPPSTFSQLDVGFDGINAESASMTEGNFTYILNHDSITVQSNLGGYYLEMEFPIVTDAGVTSAIFCCPNPGDKNGAWLCKSVSGGYSVGSCYEIK